MRHINAGWAAAIVMCMLVVGGAAVALADPTHSRSPRSTVAAPSCKMSQLAIQKRVEGFNPGSPNAVESYMMVFVDNHGAGCTIRVPGHVRLGAKGKATKLMPLRYGAGSYWIPARSRRNLIVTAVWPFASTRSSSVFKCKGRIRNVTHGSISVGAGSISFRLSTPWSEVCKAPERDWFAVSK